MLSELRFDENIVNYGKIELCNRHSQHKYAGGLWLAKSLYI